MFPADTLPSQYCEEQAAKFEAKRLARLQAQAAQARAASCSAASTPTSSSSQQSQVPSPQSITQALLTRPAMGRAATTGFLGTMFSGFAKAKSASSTGTLTPPMSGMSTPAKEKSFAEMEAYIAERKKDADICAMPSW